MNSALSIVDGEVNAKSLTVLKGHEMAINNWKTAYHRVVPVPSRGWKGGW